MKPKFKVTRKDDGFSTECMAGTSSGRVIVYSIPNGLACVFDVLWQATGNMLEDGTEEYMPIYEVNRTFREETGIQNNRPSFKVVTPTGEVEKDVLIGGDEHGVVAYSLEKGKTVGWDVIMQSNDGINYVELCAKPEHRQGKKYYYKEIRVTILSSDSAYAYKSLQELGDAIDSGNCVAEIRIGEDALLSGEEEARSELTRHNLDPKLVIKE